jgi:imidazolonepropionase
LRLSQFVYRKIACLVTNEGIPHGGGVRPVEADLGLVREAALVFSRRAGVLWLGPDRELPRQFRERKWRHLDCRGLTAYPGLVDGHTHPVFAGDRSREFELRMKGATYQEIAAAGGGIVSTVAATRRASSATLSASLRERIRTARGFGVRLMEAKSGYGLDHKSELRSLQVIRAADQEEGVALVPTCMAAHAIPNERKSNRRGYINEILTAILPAVARKKLAAYVDVFCDEGYFSVGETLEILSAGRELGLGTRVHGEELGFTGIAAKAAEAGAHSVDHLLKVDAAGIKALARHGTVAMLLPGTGFYLREKPAPARALIDQGAVVALATDFNPGTCPTQNLPFIGSLAAISLGMSTAEIIAAITWNSARSLRRENEFGTLMPGSRGEPAFAQGDHPSALFYRLAPASLPVPLSFTR